MQPSGQQTGTFGGPQTRQGPPIISPVTVHDIVETDVVTAERDTPIQTVVAMMAEEDVGTVVVVEDDRPVGIITDRKVAMALEETPDISSMAAVDLMTENLVTVTEDENVMDVVQTMSDEGIRRVPVVNDDGELEGIISLDDILVLLAGELGNVGEVVRKQAPRF